MYGSARQILLYKLSNLKVETWIVHQDHDVGLELDNRILAILHVLQDFAKMCDDGYESHIRHITVMLHQRAAFVMHHVSAKSTAYTRPFYLSSQGFHY